MIHVICRLTAKNRDQLWNPTLGNRVWATFFTRASSRLLVNFVKQDRWNMKTKMLPLVLKTIYVYMVGQKIAHFQRSISLEPFKFNNETDFTKMLHILCKLAQFYYRPIKKWQLSTVLVENISCYNLVKYQTNFIVFDCCYHK